VPLEQTPRARSSSQFLPSTRAHALAQPAPETIKQGLLADDAGKKQGRISHRHAGACERVRSVKYTVPLKKGGIDIAPTPIASSGQGLYIGVALGVGCRRAVAP